MSKSISNGLSVDIPVQATHSLKLAWLGGTYTAQIISGAANVPVALATNSASDKTFGPYAKAIMVRLTVSAIGRVAWDTASAPAFIPPGEQFTRQDDGIPVTLSGVGPAAAFAVDGGGITVASWAALPDPSVLAEITIAAPVIPGGTPNTKWRSDGTAFRPSGAQDLLVDVVPTIGTTGTTEQILKQWLLPQGLLQALRYMRVYCGSAKSGSTDSASIRARLGILGTVADTQLYSDTGFVAANRQRGQETWLYGTSTTQVRVMFTGSTGLGIGNSTSVAYPLNISVANAELYLSLSLQMSGSVDTPSIPHIIITAG